MHAPQKKNNNKNTSHWNNQRPNESILWISRGYNKLVLEIIKFLSKHRQSKDKVQLYFKALCHYFGKVIVNNIIIDLLLTNLFAYIWLSCFYALCTHNQIQNFETSSQTKFCLSEWKIIEILTVCNIISWFCVIVLRPIDIKLCKQ